MGISTQIEIQAAPEIVRAKFLDFAKIPNYHRNGFIKSIGTAPSAPRQKQGKELEAGDKILAVLDGMTFEPVIVENSPQVFSWLGSIPGVFSGTHFFRFKPSKATPGATTFEHGEEFSGTLAFTIGENWFARMIGVREKTKGGFEGFNSDLKSWCERKD